MKKRRYKRVASGKGWVIYWPAALWQTLKPAEQKAHIEKQTQLMSGGRQGAKNEQR